MAEGYYRMPAVYGGRVVFVCEDDLWEVPLEGGVARRLTASLGAVDSPCFSPDGEWLAFTARDEGAWEVFVMPSEGGEAQRLTFQGAAAEVAAWSRDGKDVIFSSSAGEAFPRSRHLWRVSRDGGMPERLPYGVANRIAYGPGQSVIIARHAGEPARWKRYRGGTAGRLWVDRQGDGEFEALTPTDGNVAAPFWLGKRVAFISDHEGVGNLYSCTPTGRNLQRLTHHEDFYVRNARTDGDAVVYHAGADLYHLDPKSEEGHRIPIQLRSPRMQLRRRYVDAARYLREYALHPDGGSLAIVSRGKLFSMRNWEGPAPQHGEAHGVHYRLAEWMNDGKRIVCVSDSSGEERVEVHSAEGPERVRRLEKFDVGRPHKIAMNPRADLIALANHRLELLLIDLNRGAMKRLDRSEHGRIDSLSWSPDGRWLAYSYAPTRRVQQLRVWDRRSGKIEDLTRPEFQDVRPAWDPDGNYLYFLSYRIFNPVYDALHFDLGFPNAARPMLLLLQKDLDNPFKPKAPDRPEEAEEKAPEKDGEKKRAPRREVRIDFDGIEDRVLSFPMSEGRYGRLMAIKNKLLITRFPLEGALKRNWRSRDQAKGALLSYDLAALREETLANNVQSFDVSRDGKTLAHSNGRQLRVYKAGEKEPDQKPQENAHDRGRSTGWINLGRIRIEVQPQAEWRQMYREAWRLQREHFWSPDMSGVDWQQVYERYLPLLERVATRGEFSDLLWEMQGELGTSHAYEIGGDYRLAPHVTQGSLGADYRYDKRAKGYRITHIVAGDSWTQAHSSLRAPGVDAREGDVIVAVNGRPVDERVEPAQHLVNLAGHEAVVTLKRGKRTRDFTVPVMRNETSARYREWVSSNRAYVHERSDGQVGYLHIPDMSAAGYAEFHRGWLPELARPALLVDVRFNGGGHVSQLLLEKLARRRLGYDIPRWGQPQPYPDDSLLGPMAALTNENAGSDGDIFSHCFKLLKLGPLIGKRTWGGVIGITVNQTMVDLGITTQPEFSFWFEDVGWRVENYGTDPDIKVDITPQDFAAGRDPQLDKGIEVLLEQMAKHPPRVPEFDARPQLPLPKLPNA